MLKNISFTVNTKNKFPRREIQGENKGGKTIQKQQLIQLNEKDMLGFVLHINAVTYNVLFGQNSQYTSSSSYDYKRSQHIFTLQVSNSYHYQAMT